MDLDKVRPRCARLFSIAGCLVLLAGCREEGAHRQLLGRVLSVHGEAAYSSGATTDFRQLDLHSMLDYGTTIRTSKDAGVDLMLLPGILVRLSEGSEITLRELRLSKDGNRPDGGMRQRLAHIELKGGKLDCYFEQPDGATGQFIVSTFRATIVAEPGCILRIEQAPSKTRVTCAVGKVHVSELSHPTSVIGQGFFQEWPATQPGPVAVTNDANAQVDLTEATATGDQLSELEADVPPHFPLPMKGGSPVITESPP
jgi:hypothetical protein